MALLFAQLTHAIGLNDVCACLRRHSGPLSALRGATPPSKNGLSRFVLVDTARHADAFHARTVCAGLRAGEIALFDRAYADCAHLYDLGQRGVCGVTPAKGSHQFRGGKKLQPKPAGKILRDDLVPLQVPAIRTGHPARLRRSVALVEVGGQEVEMTFLTNHFERTARSVVALYKERWQIEVFFKRMKQTLQRADFWGNSAAAARSQWGQSFVRLWAVRRASLWRRSSKAVGQPRARATQRSVMN